MDPFREDFNPREALTSLSCPFDILPSISFDRYSESLAEEEPEIIRALMRIEDEEFATILSTASDRPSMSKRARLKRLAELCAAADTVPTVQKPKRTAKKRVKQINVNGGGRAFLCTTGSTFERLETWMRNGDRVNVKLRGHSSLSTANVGNRLMQGVIMAFDKHWNLLLSDVDEIYTPAVRLKKVQASKGAMPPGAVYEAMLQGSHYLLQRHLSCSLITGSSIICVYKPEESFPVFNP